MGQSLGKGGRQSEWTEPKGDVEMAPRPGHPGAAGPRLGVRLHSQSSMRAAHGEAQAFKSSSGWSVETWV